MNGYCLGVALVCAFASGEALGSYRHTREWFYKWSVPLFALMAIVNAAIARYAA